MDYVKWTQNQLGIKFPKVYMEFINSEYINNNSIFINDEMIKIRKFLSTRISDKENIINEYRENESLMLEGVVPIAVTEYEDYICLYYNDHRELEPRVILWCYELAVEDIYEAMFEVANSVEEFIKMLIRK